MWKKLLSCCAALMLLLCAQAHAETLSIQDVTTKIGENAVSYP